MSGYDAAAVRGALDALREAEAGMTPGEWEQSEEEEWDCNGPSDCPCRGVEEWTPAACSAPYLCTGAWIEGPNFLESGEACYFTNADAAGIAALRNAAPALIAVAEACADALDAGLRLPPRVDAAIAALSAPTAPDAGTTGTGTEAGGAR